MSITTNNATVVLEGPNGHHVWDIDLGGVTKASILVRIKYHTTKYHLANCFTEHPLLLDRVRSSLLVPQTKPLLLSPQYLPVRSMV